MHTGFEFRKALVGILLWGSPLVATAQTSMEFSCPTPGTKLTFDTGSSLTFIGQEGFYCKAENSLGVVADVYALLHPLTAARKADPSWTKYVDPVRVELLWPLVSGKKHQGSATIFGNTFNLEYVVTGQETIDTPMGPTDTFVVELKEFGSNRYRADAKWWISLQHKYPIKYEFRSNASPPGAYRVTSVSSVGQSPNK